MAKDPAFLFYPNDWLGGTMYLSRHQKGCYMDLLIAQFNNGPLSLETIKTVLGQDQANWTALSSKFKKDSNGNFFNERLATEIEKRKKFSKSRRDNVNKRYKSTYVNTSVEHMNLHMENRNENENENCYFEKSEKLLIPALYKIFVEKNSGYLKNETEDFTALKIILKYLCELLEEDINRIFNNTAAHHTLKLRWGEIVSFIVKDSFYQSFDLPGIQRNFRAIILKQKNGNTTTFKKPNNSKSAGRDKLADEIAADIDFYR